MILCRDILTALELDLKIFVNIVIGDELLYEGFSATMVDASNWGFKPLTENIVKPEKSFINAYINECLESEGATSSNRRMHRIMDARYKNYELNKVMYEKCQH